MTSTIFFALCSTGRRAEGDEGRHPPPEGQEQRQRHRQEGFPNKGPDRRQQLRVREGEDAGATGQALQWRGRYQGNDSTLIIIFHR